ncbi:MAG: LacI family transcriptional regulator [Mycobacterium sp.]|jgi:LacI family transcriptional regulator|nr:LacI family transcriptional regulator [Mycobacterium sp.]
MGSSQRVTLASVATAAGVDVSLVSRVLRGQTAGERAETRERILYHASNLGYRPNTVARSLRTATAGAYGLVVPDFNNPVYGSIIAGAERAAAASNSVILVGSGAGWKTEDWYNALASGRVDGLLVMGGEAPPEIVRLGVPYLFVNRAAGGMRRTLTLDDGQASRLAVRHLIDQGHTRIAHIGGPVKADTAERRLSGYREALKDAGLTADSVLVVRGQYTPGGGARALGTLLRRTSDFTAILVANVTAAIGVLSALAHHGIEVPRDVSVVAIHDADIAAYAQPALTTVRMPLQRLGARAIELLREREPDEPIEEVLDRPIQLVVRESTRTL